MTDAEVLAHYEQTRSCIKTGKHFGITMQTVCTAVRRAGGEVRKGRKRFVNHMGYAYVFIPKGDPLHYLATNGRCYALEHRVVMTQRLGRALAPGENVHHINGVRDDNRIENLELWQKPQTPGVRMRCNHCGSTDVSAV